MIFTVLKYLESSTMLYELRTGCALLQDNEIIMKQWANSTSYCHESWDKGSTEEVLVLREMRI